MTVPRQLGAQSLKKMAYWMRGSGIWTECSQGDWAIHGYVRQSIDSHFIQAVERVDGGGQLQLQYVGWLRVANSLVRMKE